MLPIIQQAPPASGGSGGGGFTTILAPTSLPAAAVYDIINIPATYAYLILNLVGVSGTIASRQPLVQLSVNNGSSFDATAGNYLGMHMDSVGSVVDSMASIGESAVQAAAATWRSTYYLFGYGAGGAKPYHYTIRPSTVVIQAGQGIYIGSALAIDAMRILWNGTGNFDAGTAELIGAS